jgi:hypothetical protein
MKTTMDIEDGLFLEAKAVAAKRRVSLKAMVEHALRREISTPVYPVAEDASFIVDEDGMPKLIRRDGQKVTAKDVRRIMDEEGI